MKVSKLMALKELIFEIKFSNFSSDEDSLHLLIQLLVLQVDYEVWRWNKFLSYGNWLRLLLLESLLWDVERILRAMIRLLSYVYQVLLNYLRILRLLYLVLILWILIYWVLGLLAYRHLTTIERWIHGVYVTSHLMQMERHHWPVHPSGLSGS